MWPYGYPEPAPSLPAPRSGSIGAPLNVIVYDTGLAPPTQSFYPPKVVRLSKYDKENIDVNPADGIADLYYAGHGSPSPVSSRRWHPASR
jgi:hypothetical protein